LKALFYYLLFFSLFEKDDFQLALSPW